MVWLYTCAFFFLHLFVVFKSTQTNKPTNNKHPLSACLGIGSPAFTSWGPTLPLLLHSSSAPLSRGNALLSEGRAHNGTSHNATFTSPPTQGRRNNQPIRHCQPLSPPAPADNHQLLPRRSIVETTISRLCLSDFAPCLLLLLCIQSALDTSTSSLETPGSKLLEKWGDQKGRSGAAEEKAKKIDGESKHNSWTYGEKKTQGARNHLL